MNKTTNDEMAQGKVPASVSAKGGAFGRVARRIFLAMTILPLVPLLTLLAIGFTYNVDNLEKEAMWRLERIALDHGRMIDSFLQERVHDLDLLAELDGLPSLAEPGRLAQVFASLQDSNSAYMDLGLIDPDGLQVAYAGPFDLLGKQYAGTPWREETLAEGRLVSDVYLGHRGTPHFTVAVAGRGAAQGWVLRATVDNDIFARLVESFSLGETGEAFIMDMAGTLQTRRRDQAQPMQVPDEMDRFPPLRDTQQSFEITTDSGTLLYALVPVNNSRWRLAVRQDRAEIFRPLLRQGLWNVAIMILGGVLILVSAWLLSRMLYRQIVLASLEKEQLKEQLFRAGRLAELGEMAAGFAHEINNPLQTMKSELTLMEMDLEDGVASSSPEQSEFFSGMRDSIAQLETQIARCAKITAGILKFGRYGEPEQVEVHPEAVVSETLALVEKQVMVNGIELVQHAPEEPLPKIWCDPGQMQQVLLNLLNNAQDAVLERHPVGGGRIDLRMEGSNGSVRITIGDNGNGMTDEVRSKVFSPFFTTKPVGKGTGLGLSICHGIVESMNGTLELATAPGSGSVFIITLPAC